MIVSIIIPVLNGEKYINRCLNSMINQTYKDIEFIIIDNGSQDSTLNIIRQFMKKDDRIKLFIASQKGVSIARNLGIANSTGDYIMFVDSDDTIDEKTISKMIDVVKQEKCDIIKCGYKLIQKDKISNCTLKKGKHNIDVKFWNDFFSTYNYNQVWGQLIKKELCQEIQFDVNIAMAEDYLYNYNLYKKTQSIFVIDFPFYNYYFNEQGMNYNKNINKVLKKINDILNVCKIINKTESDYTEIINNRFIYEILPHIRDLLLNEEFNIKKLDFFLNDKFYNESLKNLSIKYKKSKYFLAILLKKKKFNTLKICFKVNKLY